MTTTDEAIEAIRAASFDSPPARSHTEWAERITAILDRHAAATIAALAPAALARLAIDRGGLEHAGVWDVAPSDEDRVTVYYQDDHRPDDAPPLYRMADPEPAEATAA